MVERGTRWRVTVECTDTGERTTATCRFLPLCSGYYPYERGCTRRTTPARSCIQHWALAGTAPTPQALRSPGVDGITETMQPRSPRLAKTMPTEILAALDAQTVVVPGTAAFGRVIAGVAAQLRDVRAERDTLAAELEDRLEAHPLAEVLTSMPAPGSGPHSRSSSSSATVRRSRPLDTAPPTPASPLSPAVPGSSIKGETRSQRGNHALKSALFLSAFASLADTTSRAYYDGKPGPGQAP